MFPAECRILSPGVKLKNKKKKSQSMYQAGRGCHSREKCHCPNSIIKSMVTSNPPELNCLTGSLFSPPCYPAPHRQRGRMYLGHLPQKSCSDTLQIGHVGVLSLNALWWERWMHSPRAVCQREQRGEERKPDEQFSRCRRMVSLPERGDTQQCLPQQVPGPEVEARIWARRERNK